MDEYAAPRSSLTALPPRASARTAPSPAASPRAGGQRRPDHRFDEAIRRRLQHLYLERLLRLEVREEPALRQVEVFGQPPDGEPFEPDPARELDGMIENGLAGGLPLAMTPAS